MEKVRGCKQHLSTADRPWEEELDNALVFLSRREGAIGIHTTTVTAIQRAPKRNVAACLAAAKLMIADLGAGGGNSGLKYDDDRRKEACCSYNSGLGSGRVGR